MTVLNKELINKLRMLRVKANLSQKDVAIRMGIKGKAGQSYIAQLESGKITNPRIGTIIDYLNACGGKRMEFFQVLDKMLAKQEQDEIVSNIKLREESLSKKVKGRTLKQKIERDANLYLSSVKYQRKPSEQLNQRILKDKIEKKVRMLLSNHKTDVKLISHYLEFAGHILQRALSPDYNPPLDYNLWLRPGMIKILLSEISHIVYQTVRTEKRKLVRRKLPSTEKQKKMVLGLVKYRQVIEQIEYEVHQLLNELQVNLALYLAYKNYARMCYKAMKKCYLKDESLLTQKFVEAKKTWLLMGLDDGVMEKIKQVVMEVYKKLVVIGSV
ncbi:MAG: helix-turn-helix domain-containing protein [Candidatus Latescibacteria bacterium]|nr:helix-turn-helix domain-containing protein [Candidatus Latescibacterota bacterium]